MIIISRRTSIIPAVHTSTGREKQNNVPGARRAHVPINISPLSQISAGLRFALPISPLSQISAGLRFALPIARSGPLASPLIVN